MFRRSDNRAVVRIRIDTVSPLLIRAGKLPLDPVSADLCCVRTRHARLGTTVYIPGASLKGVVRSTAEAMLRGREVNDVEVVACDPLDKDHSCSRRVRQRFQHNESDSADIHRAHCLHCRVFGSQQLKGRVGIRDLMPWHPEAPPEEAEAQRRRANRVEVRYGVSIDRIKGSVKHGPFEQEVVPAGASFWGELTLENYQGWQLGLLASALDDLHLGLAQLGSSKTSGLGLVQVHVLEILHEQRAGVAKHPVGVGRLLPPQDRERYGLLDERPLGDATGQARGLSTRFHLDATAAAAFLEQGRTALEVLL